MVEKSVSGFVLACSICFFGAGRPALSPAEGANVIGGLPECNVSYYEDGECYGARVQNPDGTLGVDPCPKDFRDWTYTYWGSEDMRVISVELCQSHLDGMGLPCGGSAENDDVSSYCEEYFWDWF